MHTRMTSVLLLIAAWWATPTASAQSLAYTAHMCSNDVSVIDVASRAVTGTISLTGSPKRIAIDPNGAFVYAVELIRQKGRLRCRASRQSGDRTAG